MKKSFKLLALVLAVVGMGSFALAGCNSSKNDDSTPATPSTEVVWTTVDQETFQAYYNDANISALDKGYSYIMMTEDETSTGTMEYLETETSKQGYMYYGYGEDSMTYYYDGTTVYVETTYSGETTQSSYEPEGNEYIFPTMTEVVDSCIYSLGLTPQDATIADDYGDEPVATISSIKMNEADGITSYQITGTYEADTYTGTMVVTFSFDADKNLVSMSAEEVDVIEDEEGESTTTTSTATITAITEISVTFPDFTNWGETVEEEPVQ